jgi:hypothetical protein
MNMNFIPSSFNQICVNFLWQQGENEVRAFIDNGLIADDIPIPDGFARLVLMSTKIEGIRGARADIAYLIQQAQIV